MTGIEYLWIIIVLLFGIIGIVRTYPKELGVTTMCVGALLLLLQFGEKIIGRLEGGLGGDGALLSSPRFEASFFIVVFLFVIYISYQGITLVFKGTPPKGALSSLLGFIIGLLNGYFIAGTVWFYLDRYHYPFGLVDPARLSDLAQRIVEFLPPKIFEAHTGYLLALLLLLLILSVWR